MSAKVARAAGQRPRERRPKPPMAARFSKSPAGEAASQPTLAGERNSRKMGRRRTSGTPKARVWPWRRRRMARSPCSSPRQSRRIRGTPAPRRPDAMAQALEARAGARGGESAAPASSREASRLPRPAPAGSGAAGAVSIGADFRWPAMAPRTAADAGRSACRCRCANRQFAAAFGVVGSACSPRTAWPSCTSTRPRWAPVSVQIGLDGERRPSISAPGPPPLAPQPSGEPSRTRCSAARPIDLTLAGGGVTQHNRRAPMRGDSRREGESSRTSIATNAGDALRAAPGAQPCGLRRGLVRRRSPPGRTAHTRGFAGSARGSHSTTGFPPFSPHRRDAPVPRIPCIGRPKGRACSSKESRCPPLPPPLPPMLPPHRPPGQKKLVIIIAAALLVVAAGGGGAVFYMKRRPPPGGCRCRGRRRGRRIAQAQEGRQARRLASAGLPPLDPFIVNLADNGRRSLRADRHHAGAGRRQDRRHAEGHMPAIRNGILMVLAHKSSAELLERKGQGRRWPPRSLARSSSRWASRPTSPKAEEENAGPTPRRKEGRGRGCP